MASWQKSKALSAVEHCVGSDIMEIGHGGLIVALSWSDRGLRIEYCRVRVQYVEFIRFYTH